MMTAMPAGVTVGVDTHADVHVAGVLCSTSHRLLGLAQGWHSSTPLSRANSQRTSRCVASGRSTRSALASARSALPSSGP